MKIFAFKILSLLGFRLKVKHLRWNCRFYGVGTDNGKDISYIYYGRRKDIACYGVNPRFKDLRLFNFGNI